ncbi:MAG: hypothetical protein Q4C42_04530 [Clostridia bacterium]|nr:hypothetical protein [Clostridia bacterium]
MTAKAEDFVFIVKLSDGRARRLRNITKFRIIREDGRAERLELAADFPYIRGIREISVLVFNEEIFTGPVLTYSCTDTVMKLTAEGRLAFLTRNEARPGIIGNPNSHMIEQMYLNESGIRFAEKYAALGEMNVEVGTSVRKLIENFALSMFGRKAYFRRGKIFFSNTPPKGEEISLADADNIIVSENPCMLCDKLKIMDRETGAYSIAIKRDNSTGRVKYLPSADMETRKALLQERRNFEFLFRGRFEDIHPGDSVKLRRKAVGIIVDRVVISGEHNGVNLIVTGKETV